MEHNSGKFGHKRNSALISILNLGDLEDKEDARLELARRGCLKYNGDASHDPEHGNGQVAPEEVKRAQEEVKTNNQQHRSEEQIGRIKQDVKKMSDDQLRSIFATGDDRELSMLAHIELLSRSNTPSVYEVKALVGEEVDTLLKRAISGEYIDYLLDRYEEVRIRKIEIE